MSDNIDDPAEQAARIKADLLTAGVLVGLGLVVTYFSWTMPRLEARHIHPSTIPGLVPIFLGVALTLCGALLGLRSWNIAADGGWQTLRATMTGKAARRVGAVLALAFVHTLVLVGFLPFWAAAMIFIFSFIMLFETVLTDKPVPLIKSLIWAVTIALIGGGGIFYVFERIFLVRLP